MQEVRMYEREGVFISLFLVISQEKKKQEKKARLAQVTIKRVLSLILARLCMPEF